MATFTKEIEKDWDKEYGDRQNELLIVEQDLDKPTIYSELENCLCNAMEVEAMFRGGVFKHRFPLE